MNSKGFEIRMFGALCLFLCAGPQCWAQEQSQPPQNPPQQVATQDTSAEKPVETERWNLFYQATSIGQYHGTFHSPYAGPFSLRDQPERDVSLTTTLFFGLCLEKNTVLYFDPEIAGGRGFSNVNGLANFSNGELPRVASWLAGIYRMTSASAARRSLSKAKKISWPASVR